MLNQAKNPDTRPVEELVVESVRSVLMRADAVRDDLHRSGQMLGSKLKENTTITTRVYRRDGEVKAYSSMKLSLTITSDNR